MGIFKKGNIESFKNFMYFTVRKGGFEVGLSIEIGQYNFCKIDEKSLSKKKNKNVISILGNSFLL